MTSPDLTIYPDEQHRIEQAYDRICRQFEFTAIRGDADKAIFESAVHNEFGEAGFLVNITWQQLHQHGHEVGMWFPGIEITGRNRKESETDHDRFKWGVVKGLADGQPGYVREDGSKHEEPIKKIIT